MECSGGCFMLKWVFYKVSVWKYCKPGLWAVKLLPPSPQMVRTHTFPKDFPDSIITAANPHSIQWIRLQVDNKASVLADIEDLELSGKEDHFVLSSYIFGIKIVLCFNVWNVFNTHRFRIQIFTWNFWRMI